MNRKLIVKIGIDLCMTVSLLLLMPYSLLGETAHEWIGMAMFLLFIVHHVLNRRWLASMTRGRYTPLRVVQTILVLVMLVLMIGSMVSGILLFVFAYTRKSMNRTEGAVKSYFPIGHNCGNIGTDGSCTYSLCILGICCNVDAFGDSLEYGGCHVRQTICASFEIESMDRKDCGSGDCRIRLICVWKTTVFGISFYENAFCVL